MKNKNFLKQKNVEHIYNISKNTIAYIDIIFFTFKHNIQNQNVRLICSGKNHIKKLLKDSFHILQ